jgi:rSAM/selenodomain-associated transferase 1
MVDLADAPVAAILTRAPSSGGKSRLFAALGRAPDPALLAALLLDTVDSVNTTGVTRIVAVDPPERCDEVRALLPGIEVVPQAAGSLGDRMAALMLALFDRGASAVALVGSDLPDLDRSLVEQAFLILGTDPRALVLGPASDGGYYLVAATSVPLVFEGVSWGTAQVLAQTMANADRVGLDVRLLEVRTDVDTVEDLRRVRAPRTAAWRRESGLDPPGGINDGKT